MVLVGVQKPLVQFLVLQSWVLDVVLKWGVIASLLIIVVTTVSGRWILSVLAPGFDAPQITLAYEIHLTLIGALVFFSVANTSAFTLNAFHYYSLPAITSLIDPFFHAAALFVLVPFMGIKGIAFSYLAANILRATILLGYLYHHIHWRPRRYWYHPRLPALIRKSSTMSASKMGCTTW